MYAIHPICAAFPAMTDNELLKLAADISERGLIYPILLHDSQIIDGKNRLKACDVAGIDPRFEDYVGADPRKHVISINIRRRHMTESQRAIVAARLANMPVGRPGTEIGSSDPISLEAAGKDLNVGRASVQRAKAVLESGNERLIRQIDSGLVSVAAAYRQIKFDPDRNEKWRRKRVDDWGSDELKAIMASGRLPVSTCCEIAGYPAEHQAPLIAAALANPNRRSLPKRRKAQPPEADHDNDNHPEGRLIGEPGSGKGRRKKHGKGKGAKGSSGGGRPTPIKMKPTLSTPSLTPEEIGERPNVPRFDNVHAPPAMGVSYAMLAMVNDCHIESFNIANAVADVRRRLKDAPQISGAELAERLKRMLDHVRKPEARNGEERDFAKEARETLGRLEKALKPALDRLADLHAALLEASLIKA